tara:strand:+ start:231 stop:1787 length:1557 start_codon:yes stop_codon:yes gene_type:complete
MSRKRADLARMVGISAAESQSQRVETRLIEPRSFSQSQATFELPMEGILSSDVALQLQLTTSETNPNVRMDLPLMAGILGCIDRAEMFFGTTLISSVENLAHLQQMKNCMVDQDIRDQTHNVYLGAFSGLKAVDGGAAVNGAGAAGNGWGQFALNAIDTVTAANTAASQGIIGLVQNTALETNKLDQFRTKALASTSPQWVVKLKEIFPVLTQIPLPLFALKERVRFVFHWSTDTVGNRAVAGDTSTAQPLAANTPFTAGNDIVEASCKLSTDLIYYEDMAGVPSPMARIQQELESGATLCLTDYVSVFSQFAAVAAGSQTLSTLLGLDHQIVRNILIATPRLPTLTALPATNQPANRSLGNYESAGPNGQNTLQVSINSENIFPSPLNTTAKLYNEFSQITDTPLKINRGLYSSNGQIDPGTGLIVPNQAAFSANQFFHGIPNTELNFKLNYLGVNLAKDATENYVGNGIQVGRQPVIVTLTKDRNAEYGTALRFLSWSECERSMLIKSGNIFMSGQ